MVGPGYKTVTIKQEIWDKIEKIREKEHRGTIPETIEHVTLFYEKNVQKVD